VGAAGETGRWALPGRPGGWRQRLDLSVDVDVDADVMYGVFEWAPLIAGWRRGSLYKGDGEGFLVHGEKKEGYSESAGEGFIPYMTIFCYWGGDRKGAEVALSNLNNHCS
jgi:hypothetical protein